MNLRPMNNRVIIKRQEIVEEKSLIFTGANQAMSNRGEVLAIGSGLVSPNGTVSPMSVKVGDIVIFTGYNLHPEKVGELEVLIIVETDIIAIVEPEQAA